ncbi:hypothetical protein OTK49_28335 [Vibrio coralliirubri]|uniref:hypothetical protein n=1 Tax=Vibrio coralliirubri TaxID=1516159 RepID=UPI002284B619|nr:hypothetical protein [Vibrio coralliirubri]MCY9866452.1 hypothetical protein [Vibrio coralliirubri]
MSDLANSKGFHCICVTTMWGANSRSVTFSIIVLCCALYVAANRFIDNELALGAIHVLLQVCVGVRGAILVLPSLRRDVCRKMGWNIN